MPTDAERRAAAYMQQAMNEVLQTNRAELKRAIEYKLDTRKTADEWERREAALTERVQALEDFIAGTYNYDDGPVDGGSDAS